MKDVFIPPSWAANVPAARSRRAIVAPYCGLGCSRSALAVDIACVSNLEGRVVQSIMQGDFTRHCTEVAA